MRAERPGAARNDGDDGLRRVGDVLGQALDPTGAHRVDEMVAIAAHWKEIVGPKVAARAHPVRLEDDELVVAAEDPVWATQLRTIRSTILARIEEVTGTRPRELRTVVRPPSPGGATPR